MRSRVGRRACRATGVVTRTSKGTFVVAVDVFVVVEVVVVVSDADTFSVVGAVDDLSA
jgi:hypothetical protein